MGSFLVGGRQLYAPPVPDPALSFEESYRCPCDVQGLLEFFAVRALPGVEAVDPERLLYRRTIDLPAVPVEAGDGAGCPPRGPAGRLRSGPPSPGPGVRRRRAEDRTGGQEGDVPPGSPAVRPGREPGCHRFEPRRCTGAGDRRPDRGRRTDSGRLEQLRDRGAGGAGPADLRGRRPHAGRPPGRGAGFGAPGRVAGRTGWSGRSRPRAGSHSFDLRTIGLPASRARALGDLASQVASGELRFDADPQEVRRRLLAVKGIGPWTVEYVAMRALGDRDAFPASDLGLRKAIDREEPPGAAELEAMAEAWRPFRAYAAILLWRGAAGG